MKAVQILLTFFVLSIVFTACKKEKTLYFEITSDGPFSMMHYYEDIYFPMIEFDHEAGEVQTQYFMRKRGEPYNYSVKSIADSSVAVTLWITVHYDEEVIDVEQVTAINQPELHISGIIP